jgi:integrase
MARNKEGYKRGWKHVRNLHLYRVHKSGRAYWRLRTPDPDGHGFRERQYSSEAEALTAFELAYLAHVNHGLAAHSLSAKNRGDALSALTILAPFENVSLVDAARYYAAHHRLLAESKSVNEVIADLLRTKKANRRSHRYLIDLSSRLTRFGLAFGTQKISEITPEQIETWLTNLGVAPLTVVSFWLRLHVLFAFAVKRRLTTDNPLDQVEKPKVIPSVPGILTPEQFARLLQLASSETLPYWAIGGFAGLRSAELEGLEWSDIDLGAGHVHVRALVSKTAQDRYVTVCPALAAWLNPYRGRTEKIWPPNLRRKLEADRTRASITEWPENALRHSFASYHYAHFKDAAMLKHELGHARETMAFQHYRHLVTPAQAKLWWTIMPPPAQSNVIAGAFAPAV